VLTIKVPPLRERREDLPLLVQEIFSQLRERQQLKEFPKIASEVWRAFENYEWPGNVRELRNVLERALMLSDHDVIGVESLGMVPDCIGEDKWAFATEFPNGRSLNDITRNLKRSLVNEALRRTGGSRTKTADLLGISRYSLKHYMKSLGINDEYGED
jgi:DNA-binding NtrC family response regulator